MKKRIGALLLALLMVMSLLAGCGDSATEDAEDTTDSTASDSTTDDSTEDSTDDTTEDTTLTEVPAEAREDPIAYVTDGAISAGDTVITANSTEVPANLYFYWLTYYYNYYSYYYYYSGYTFDVTEVVDEDSGSTVADTLVYMATNISEMYAVLNDKADEYGLTLTEDQETSLAEVLANYDDNALLYYATNAEGLEQAYRQSCQATNLQDYFYGEGGEYEPTDATVAGYAEEQGYYTCRYILLYTADLEDDDDEGRAAQQEAAQAIYDALQDVSADELEDTFAEYQAESNYDGNTDEYTFDSDDSLVDGFRELVETLEVGELGMTDETDYGYFVILRLDNSEGTLADIEDDYISDLYNSQIDEWMTASTFETSEALDGMDWQACFEKIIDLQTAVAAEEEAAAEEEEESEDADTTEDSDTTEG